MQVQPDNGLGYLGQGDSLKGLGNFSAALDSFTRAITLDEKSQNQGMMKRGCLLLQMKEFTRALSDFTELSQIKEPPQMQAQAYFYKAKTLKKM